MSKNHELKWNAKWDSITSQGFRHGGWKVCLQGNSCISSFTTKFSLQMAHSASLPSFSNTSSVMVMIGRFATTSLLAGGTLGAPLSSSIILFSQKQNTFFIFLNVRSTQKTCTQHQKPHIKKQCSINIIPELENHLSFR